MREVLVENRAKWRHAKVRTGDQVFISLPTTAEVVACKVTLPDGDQVELEVRRRDGLTADTCAVIDTTQEGQHGYVFSLASGKQARGKFTVHPARPNGRKPNRPARQGWST